MQPLVSLMAASNSDVELLIREPRPTIPPTKQPRCWTWASKSGLPEWTLTVPENRISGSPGRLGRKIRCSLIVDNAVRYILRYCSADVDLGSIKCVFGRYSKAESLLIYVSKAKGIWTR